MITRLTQTLIPLSLAAFVLAGTVAVGQAATPVPVLSDKSAVGELTFWNSIKESGVADDYRTYLENFPNGMFVDPAMERFEKSGGAKADLSPDVITASLNATVEPAITDDAVTADVPAVVPKPMQRKKVVKVKKKAAVAAKSKKKSSKSSARSAKKCTGSIYENKCIAAAKPKKVKQAVVRKKKIVDQQGGNSGGGGGSPGGGGGSPGGGWGG